MSKLTDVLVSGTLANVVFYRRMGTNCVRIKRESIKQTEATKKRGINFGIAARAGKGLRAGLSEVMPIPSDRKAQNRLSGAIAKWLGQSDIAGLQTNNDIPYVSQLAFAGDKGFYSRCKVAMQVSTSREGVTRLTIPAMIPVKDISAPANTLALKIIFAVSACLLPGGESAGHQTHSLEIPYNQVEIPAMVFDFAVPAPPKSLTVMAARLVYYQSSGPLTIEIDNPAFAAAGIIAGWYRQD